MTTPNGPAARSQPAVSRPPRSIPGSAPRLPSAVLWDLDGTLVDTEPYWIESETELVEDFGGGQWSLADAHALVGNDLRVSAAALRERGGVDLTIEEIIDRLVAEVARKVRSFMPWRPGAHELLLGLRALDVPCALVTMSYLPLVEAVVETLPPGTFAAVVTGDAVIHGKPHPEPYRTAVELLGRQPHECLALEDSLTGVRSAEAAGVPTIGVLNLVEIPPAPRRRLVSTLAGLGPADLARWLPRPGTDTGRAGRGEPGGEN